MIISAYFYANLKETNWLKKVGERLFQDKFILPCHHTLVSAILLVQCMQEFPLLILAVNAKLKTENFHSQAHGMCIQYTYIKGFNAYMEGNIWISSWLLFQVFEEILYDKIKNHSNRDLTRTFRTWAKVKMMVMFICWNCHTMREPIQWNSIWA